MGDNNTTGVWGREGFGGSGRSFSDSVSDCSPREGLKNLCAALPGSGLQDTGGISTAFGSSTAPMAGSPA